MPCTFRWPPAGHRKAKPELARKKMTSHSETSGATAKAEFLEKTILNHLVGIRSNFAIGLQFWALLQNPQTAGVVKIHRVVVKEDGICAIPPGKSKHVPEGEQFYYFEPGGPKGSNFNHASMEFAKMLLRTFITEGFEKLKGYCESTDQTQLLKKQAWYQFARMVRNCLKHSQHWSFNNYDLSILPVTWHSKTIEALMNDKEMTWEFFDCFDSLELWDEMYEFAKTLK